MVDFKIEDSPALKISIGTALIVGGGFLLGIFFGFGPTAFDLSKESYVQWIYGDRLMAYFTWHKIFIEASPYVVLMLVGVGGFFCLRGVFEAFGKIREKGKRIDATDLAFKSIVVPPEISKPQRSGIRTKSVKALSGPISEASERSILQSISTAASSKYEMQNEVRVGKYHVDLIAKPIVKSPLASKDIVVELKVLRRGAHFNWLSAVIGQLSLLANLYTLETGRPAFPVLLIAASHQVQASSGLVRNIRRAESLGLVGSGILAVRLVELDKIGNLDFVKTLGLLREG